MPRPTGRTRLAGRGERIPAAHEAAHGQLEVAGRAGRAVRVHEEGEGDDDVEAEELWLLLVLVRDRGL